MQRIIICLLALGISFGCHAQIWKKTKTKAVKTEQADSSASKKDSSASKKDSSASQPQGNENQGKFDYKSANKKAAEKNASDVDNSGNSEDNSEAPDKKTSSKNTSKAASKTAGKTSSKATSKPAAKTTAKTSSKNTAKTTAKTVAAKPKPGPRPKPMTAAEKKKAAEEAAEIEAATPRGIEALYYQFPLAYLPVVQDFMDFKQSENPLDELHHVKIKDDISLRKQIIRFKDIDHGYMMLQKPGETKYTKMQIYKKKNGNIIMAVEQTDCPNNVCAGTLQFYTKTAGGWKETTDEFDPQIDHKFVISRLKSAYKKEYKDLELYNSHNYEDDSAALKKAITYQIAPEDGSIVIAEQNLPCKIYTMTWDPKKEKFELKKVEN